MNRTPSVSERAPIMTAEGGYPTVTAEGGYPTFSSTSPS